MQARRVLNEPCQLSTTRPDLDAILSGLLTTADLPAGDDWIDAESLVGIGGLKREIPGQAAWSALFVPRDRMGQRFVGLNAYVLHDPNLFPSFSDPVGAIVSGAGPSRALVIEGPSLGEESHWMGDAPVGVEASVGLHAVMVLFRMANVEASVRVAAYDDVRQDETLTLARIVESRLGTALADSC